MNTIRRLQFLAIGAIAMGAFGSGGALAATATATFQVTANVLASCSVSAGTLAFGSYTGLAQVAVNSAVVASCTDTTTYNIGLNTGLAPGATVTTRAMRDGANLHSLPYFLYSDAARTVNWGNTIGVDTVAGTGNGLAQPITVYGLIPVGELVVPNPGYTDTISVTLTY